MTNQVIPDEAVEAAAWLLHDREGYLELFEDAPTHRRERFLEIARAALEAAAPHMLADASDAAPEATMRADLLKIIQDDDNYTSPDWVLEVDEEAMTEALMSYVLRVKANAFNDGYNAATDAHGITK